MKWEAGRQKTGYDKCLLLQGRRFDCYLLRYRPGSFIPPHTDPVEKLRHYRLNIVIKPSKIGGVFECKDPIFQWGPIKFFRPDRSEHSVSQVEGSSRYVLSIGWVR